MSQSTDVLSWLRIAATVARFLMATDMVQLDESKYRKSEQYQQQQASASP